MKDVVDKNTRKIGNVIYSCEACEYDPMVNGEHGGGEDRPGPVASRLRRVHTW